MRNSAQAGFIHVLILVIVLGLIAGSGYFLLTKYKNPITDIPSAPPTSTLAPVSKPIAVSGDVQKLKDTSKILADLVNNQNPRIALDKLAELVASDNQIANVCHSLAHEIGRAAFYKYKSVTESLKYRDEVCGSGYIHGVIETKLESTTNFEEDLKTLCQPKNDGNCYHGVGHGAMLYTENLIPKALKICDYFGTNLAKIVCSEGVFMENFNTDLKIHPSSFLPNDDSFYPCTEQPEFYAGSCYYYAPRYFLKRHPKEYTKALDWCLTADKTHRADCATGVGSATMKFNINEPIVALNACKTGQKEQVNLCLDGMVSYYLVHYYSLNKGRELCNSLAEPDKTVCSASVKKRGSLFPD